MAAQTWAEFVTPKTCYDYPRLSIPVEVSQDGKRTSFVKVSRGNDPCEVLQRIFNGSPHDGAILSQQRANAKFRETRKRFVLSEVSNVLGKNVAEHLAHRVLRNWSTGLNC